MNTITIPRKLASGGDLVVLPRKEYEALLEMKKYKEFTPTARQKKALAQARKNYRAGKTFTLHELKQKLGFTN
jgi:hypothetical protein